MQLKVYESTAPVDETIKEVFDEIFKVCEKHGVAFIGTVLVSHGVALTEEGLKLDKTVGVNAFIPENPIVIEAAAKALQEKLRLFQMLAKALFVKFAENSPTVDDFEKRLTLPEFTELYSLNKLAMKGDI